MEIIKKIDIPLENMIGFGSDGANNVSSQNNSLWTKLNEAAGGNAYQFKCTCHSLGGETLQSIFRMVGEK